MNNKKIWHEKLHDNIGQYLYVNEILYKNKTPYHDVIIFKNPFAGKVLAIDNVVQTSEKDEFIYHEMLTHVPIFTHSSVNNVLIIGGGDGGILREVCKHKKIKNITMVEIDIEIVNLCKKYFPNHNNNSYEDPRVKLVIKDGLEFIKNTSQTFDVIISDSTDPVNHGKNLFSSEFYFFCKKRLNKNGIFVAQNGIFFLQKKEAILTYKKLKKYFNIAKFYHSTIPTYYGGIMMFAWSTDNIEFDTINLNILKKRIEKTKIHFNHYNAGIHVSSFYLPQHILNALKKI